MTRKVFLILLALVLALSVGSVACPPSEQQEEEEEPGTWTDWGFGVIAMEEWVWTWDEHGYPDIPNGALTFPMEPCPSIGLLATGQMLGIRPLQATTFVYYDVVGDDCPQVRDDIFDATNGKGFKVGNVRYGAKCELTWKFYASYYPHNGTTIIKGLTWINTIRLPRWVNKDACNVTEDVQEWDRCIAKVEEHEIGHRDIYDAGMAAVNTTVVGQLMQLAPGLNRTEFEAAATAAVTPIVEGTRPWQDMQQATTNYDDPFDAQNNPTGTNHGETQNATLNCPP